MLVLSRTKEEEIVINPGSPSEIRVKILEVRASKVLIGLTAPPDVKILRAELCESNHGGES